MAQLSLAVRTAEYIDNEVRCVDIHKCIPGAHARAIKPGGIEKITDSIRDDGYKRVTCLRQLILITNTLTHCKCAVTGVNDQRTYYN
jgi:hypothetical protein